MRIGGRHVSTEGALRRFLAAQQTGGAPEGGAADRALRDERTAKQLDAILGPVA
jgi:hypothetical protein